MSQTLRIKITGELPLPNNAFDAARLTLALEAKIRELGALLGDNGGGMVDKCWPAQGRKRKGRQEPLVVTPMFHAILDQQGLADGFVANKPLPVDDPLHIPPFLKGGAP